MATWNFVLTNSSGMTLSECSSARNKKIKFKRNESTKVTFKTSLVDEEASKLINGLNSLLPRLKVYRDGVLEFNGIFAGLKEQAQKSTFVDPIFRDPFYLLKNRYTAASKTFSSTDAGSIAWTLISDTDGEGDTAIKQGSIETTKPRDRSYEHKQVAEAITQLTDVLDGFDFEMVPIDDEETTIAAFNVYADRGSDKPLAIFENGPTTIDNVSNVVRKTIPPINKVRVVGEGDLQREASDATSISKYGLWMIVETRTDVNNTASLLEKAQEALMPNPITVIKFNPDPGLAPVPFVDYDIGDTIRLRANRDAMQIDTSPRVDSIEVKIDDSGNEVAHTLGLEESTL